MKARILTLTVVGSLALAASPAYAGGNTRQLQFVIAGDGGSGAAAVHRSPTAVAHHLITPPWVAPNRDQVTRNAI